MLRAPAFATTTLVENRFSPSATAPAQAASTLPRHQPRLPRSSGDYLRTTRREQASTRAHSSPAAEAGERERERLPPPGPADCPSICYLRRRSRRTQVTRSETISLGTRPLLVSSTNVTLVRDFVPVSVDLLSRYTRNTPTFNQLFSLLTLHLDELDTRQCITLHPTVFNVTSSGQRPSWFTRRNAAKPLVTSRPH
jgi:hypothetical protein